MKVSIEPWRRAEPPDYDFPSCGAADEYGNPIYCRDCIWKNSCVDSTCREEEAEEPDCSDAEDPSPSPCLHRFEINEPACRVCSGLPRGVCVLYET